MCIYVIFSNEIHHIWGTHFMSRGLIGSKSRRVLVSGAREALIKFESYTAGSILGVTLSTRFFSIPDARTRKLWLRVKQSYHNITTHLMVDNLSLSLPHGSREAISERLLTQMKQIQVQGRKKCKNITTNKGAIQILQERTNNNKILQ